MTKKIAVGDRVQHSERTYGLRVLQISGERAQCERYHGTPKNREWLPLSRLNKITNPPPSTIRFE